MYRRKTPSQQSMAKILRRPIVLVFQALIRLADRATSETSRRENGLVLAVRAVKASR